MVIFTSNVLAQSDKMDAGLNLAATTSLKLYWTQSAGVYRANLTGTDVQTLSSGSDLKHIAVDQINGKVYWTGEKIFRANLDGSNVEVVLDTSANGIAVDGKNGKVYWVTPKYTRDYDYKIDLYWANLDGSQSQLLRNLCSYDLSYAVPDYYELAIDLENSKLFWASMEYCYSANYIQIADLNGTNASPIVSEGYYIQGYSIAVDPPNNKLYYVAYTEQKELYRVNYDGTDNEFVMTLSDEIAVSIGLDTANNKMYWIDADRDTIWRNNLDGSGIQEVIFEGPTGSLQSLKLDVVPNEPPSATPDDATTNEDTKVTIDVLSNDSESEGDPLSVHSVSAPAHGEAAIEDNFVVYTPELNYFGADSFSYNVTDGKAGFDRANVDVIVNSLNDAPTGIQLSSTTIGAQNPPGTEIGTLTSTDPDLGDTHILTFGTGDGSEDNGDFSISGQTLYTAKSFDIDIKDSYNITIISDDEHGGTLEKAFTIQLIDLREGPLNIRLSNNVIYENKPVGTGVGSFTSVDEYPTPPYVYSLVSGYGSDDNAAFKIDGDKLKSNVSFDYENQHLYSIRIRSENQFGSTEKKFNITIQDIAEPPADKLSKCSGEDITLIDTDTTLVKVTDITITSFTKNSCNLTGKMRVEIPGSSRGNISLTGQVNNKNNLQSKDGIADFSLVLAGLELKAKQVSLEYNAGKPQLRIGTPKLAMPTEWGGSEADIDRTTVINGGGLVIGMNFKMPMIRTTAGYKLGLKGSVKDVPGGYEISASGDFSLPNIGKNNQTCKLNVNVALYSGEQNAIVMEIDTPQKAWGTTAPDVLRLREAGLGLSCSIGIPIDTTGFSITGVSGKVNLRPDEESVSLSLTISSQTKLFKTPVIKTVGTATVRPSPFLLNLTVDLYVLSFNMANASATIKQGSFSTTLNIKALIVDGSVKINAWTSDGKFHFTGSGKVRLYIRKGAIVQECLTYPCKPSLCWKWFVPYPCKWKRCQSCINIPRSTWEGPYVGIDFGEFRNGAYGLKGYVTIAGTKYGFFIDHKGNFKVGGVDKYVLVQASLVNEVREKYLDAQSNGTLLAAEDIDPRFSFPAKDVILINVPVGLSERTQTSMTGEVITNTTIITPANTSFVVKADGDLDISLIDPDGYEIDPSNYDLPPVNDWYQITYTQTEKYEPADAEELIDESMSRVRIAHAAPLPDLSEVDVIVDGSILFANVDFNELPPAGYASLSPGTHQVEIVRAGGTQVEITSQVLLESGKEYSFIIVGASNSQVILVEDDDRAPENLGEARVRLMNASDTHTVDVYIDGASLFEDITSHSVSDYAALSEGDHTLEIREGGSSLVLSQPNTVTLQEGGVYTILAVDWENDPANSMAWIQRLDEWYVPMVHTQYDVSQVSGDWKVKLSGDVENIQYSVGVFGTPNAPTLENLAVDASDLSRTRVSWNLTSSYAPTQVTLFVTPGPIIETLTISDTEGGTTSVEIPLFTGAVFSSLEVYDQDKLSGELMKLEVDLTNLESGEYYLWLRAEDGVSPPVEGYVAFPAMAAHTSVQVLDADYDSLQQMASAAKIVVDNTSTFPNKWEAQIRTTPINGEGVLYVEWDALEHQDIDNYMLYAGTSPLSASLVLETGNAMSELDENGEAIGERIGFATIHNVVPGETYYLSVKAIDEDHNLSVRSQDVTQEIDPGSYTLSTPKDWYLISAGDTITVEVTLDVNEELFYTWVDLSLNLENAPKGVYASFPADLDGKYSLSEDYDKIDVIITAANSAALGYYPITILGYNGQYQVSKTIDLYIDVIPLYMPYIRR